MRQEWFQTSSTCHCSAESLSIDLIIVAWDASRENTETLMLCILSFKLSSSMVHDSMLHTGKLRRDRDNKVANRMVLQNVYTIFFLSGRGALFSAYILAKIFLPPICASTNQWSGRQHLKWVKISLTNNSSKCLLHCSQIYCLNTETCSYIKHWFKAFNSNRRTQHRGCSHTTWCPRCRSQGWVPHSDLFHTWQTLSRINLNHPYKGNTKGTFNIIKQRAKIINISATMCNWS